MTEPNKPPQSNSSRTVVIVAVAVLIVVAIAGIVLAGRKAPPDAAVAAAPVSAAASVSTPQVPSPPTSPVLKDIVFEARSDKLPAGSNEGIAGFAEAVRSSASSVRLTARFLTGANKARDLELAKARTTAIRHALEANGITGGRMQVELVEMPAGALTEDVSNRVDVGLR